MRRASTDLFVALAALWMVAMTWRVYPLFRDTIRVDGRLTSMADYLDDACGQRVGPAAVTCAAEAREQARLLLRREQGRSVLLIIAPALAYLVIYLPARFVAGRLSGRGSA
jgi:hypothetical protein